MKLETLENAKLHIHVTDPARDAEVTLVLEHASALVYDYMGAQADDTWDESTTPDIVQRAVLQTVAHLWDHRGDDGAPAEVERKFWEGISLLLMRKRDPALA